MDRQTDRLEPPGRNSRWVKRAWWAGRRGDGHTLAWRAVVELEGEPLDRSVNWRGKTYLRETSKQTAGSTYTRSFKK